MMNFFNRLLNKPKYNINDPVAVSAPGKDSFAAMVVIPKTLVTERRYYNGDQVLHSRDPRDNPIRPAKGWWYEVLHARGTLYHERFLRPYRDDDYNADEDLRMRRRERVE